MAKYLKKASDKVEKVMHEKKKGVLKSGRSGKKVTSKAQAIAIGLSEARKEGAKVPKKAAAKKSAGRPFKKSASKKSAPKKSAPQKAATKRSPAKKTVLKKTAFKKSPSKQAAPKKKVASNKLGRRGRQRS
jgi:hypothetical protein